MLLSLCSCAVDEVGSNFIAVDDVPGLGNSGRGSRMSGKFQDCGISRVEMKLKCFPSRIKIFNHGVHRQRD